MNEKTLITTLRECVDYLAKKYKLGKATEHHSSDYSLQYRTPDRSPETPYISIDYVSLEREEPDTPLEFEFMLGCCDKYVNIRVSTKEERIRSCKVFNDTEDFDYVYGKIKEALK